MPGVLKAGTDVMDGYFTRVHHSGLHIAMIPYDILQMIKFTRLKLTLWTMLWWLLVVMYILNS